MLVLMDGAGGNVNANMELPLENNTVGATFSSTSHACSLPSRLAVMGPLDSCCNVMVMTAIMQWWRQR